MVQHSWKWHLLCLGMLGGGFLLPSLAGLPGSALGSAISLPLLALPSLLPLRGWRTWLGIIILAVLAYSLEALSITYGIPYGFFTYGDAMPGKLFDLVPWGVPFAWIPLLLGAWSVSRGKYLTFIGILLLTDLLLDPGAVALGFWTYAHPSAYYGVPLSNFIGWIVSGTLGWLVLQRLSLPEKGLDGSLLLTLCLWIGVAIQLKFWLPVIFGTITLLLGWKNDRQTPNTSS